MTLKELDVLDSIPPFELCPEGNGRETGSDTGEEAVADLFCVWIHDASNLLETTILASKMLLIRR